MKTILTFLLLAAFAEARIGETLEECIKRYGNPITVDKDLGTTTFLKEGFVVVVKFTDGGKIIVNWYMRIIMVASETNTSFYLCFKILAKKTKLLFG